MSNSNKKAIILQQISQLNSLLAQKMTNPFAKSNEKELNEIEKKIQELQKEFDRL